MPPVSVQDRVIIFNQNFSQQLKDFITSSEFKTFREKDFSAQGAPTPYDLIDSSKKLITLIVEKNIDSFSQEELSQLDSDNIYQLSQIFSSCFYFSCKLLKAIENDKSNDE
jgi:hypothetical protein